MRKRFYAVCIGLSGLFPIILHGVPLTTYPVELKVECPTPDAAKTAELKFLELPEGKKVAFSARWDDSSVRHLLMRELMKKHGYKGTFYLHDTGRKEFWEKVFPALVSDGFTVGNHTWGHRELPQLTPRGIHYEILGWKIRLEQRSDQPVTSFVLPYGKFNSRFFPGVPKLIGCSVHRSGLLGGPDFSPEMYRHYGLKENEFFGSLLVRPGDINTRPEKFDADVERHLKAAAGKPVHLTLGIHTRHSEEDFRKLALSLKKYGARPDWWYCNENEYLAYTYMFRNVRVTGKKVNGNTIVFTVELPCPELLGSDIPLWAECAGKKYPIRHTRKVPTVIGETSPAGKNAKFPGVTAKLTAPSPDKIRLDLTNTGDALKNVLLTLRPGPDFRTDCITEQIDEIGKDISREWSVEPDPERQGPGAQLIAVQMDFTRGGRSGRLWVTRIDQIKREEPDRQVRCSLQAFSAEEQQRLSLTGTTPPAGTFHPAVFTNNQRPGVYNVKLPRQQKPHEALTAIMDYESDSEMVLRGELPPTVWFAGARVNPGPQVKLNAGKHRLQFVYPPGKCPDRNLVLILEPAAR
ncbi:MAG: polysaccharide deacetylase family protein [Lentisphaeria bacterium]|nr:polysaccharide deacetylase family protein [Lentisphaeria bacterium]